MSKFEKRARTEGIFGSVLYDIVGIFGRIEKLRRTQVFTEDAEADGSSKLAETGCCGMCNIS